MSIKRIPVCPFCKTDMEKLETGRNDGRVELIEALTRPGNTIEGSGNVKAWNCPKCRFIALFTGEGPY